jgi:hypothetical protein
LVVRVGLSLGSAYPTAAMFIAENIPTSHRGRLVPPAGSRRRVIPLQIAPLGSPWAKQAKPLTVYADCFAMSHLIQEAFRGPEMRKGGSQCSFFRKDSRIEIS